VEPERWPLLASGTGTIFFSRQRLDKRFPGATDTHTTEEVLLETVRSAWFVEGPCAEDGWGNQVSSVRESVKKRDS
jgi:hypothetical protein